MNNKKTERGFTLIEFEDFYGSRCSLQESSLATEAAVWLGVDTPSPRYKPERFKEMVRMHLTQEQVRELLPLLQHFAKTGNLPEPRG